MELKWEAPDEAGLTDFLVNRMQVRQGAEAGEWPEFWEKRGRKGVYRAGRMDERAQGTGQGHLNFFLTIFSQQLSHPHSLSPFPPHAQFDAKRVANGIKKLKDAQAKKTQVRACPLLIFFLNKKLFLLISHSHQENKSCPPQQK